MDDYFLHRQSKPSLYEISPARTNRHFTWVILAFILAFGTIAGKLVLYGTGVFRS